VSHAKYASHFQENCIKIPWNSKQTLSIQNNVVEKKKKTAKKFEWQCVSYSLWQRERNDT
jgi:hypothetical protein